MRAPLLLGSVSSAVFAGVVAFACAPQPFSAGREPIDVEDDVVDAGMRPRPDAGDGTDPDPFVDPLPPDSGASGRVLAHTARELYRLVPETKTLTKIGEFGCLPPNDSMIDLAVDRSGSVYGTTFTGFVTIDPLSAGCSFVAKGQGYPNSLSFVPAGTADATKEALVGYAFDGAFAVRYVRIDTSTGAMTDLGKLNPTNATTQYVSSGDLVGLVNDANRAYLTVRLKDALADGGTLPDRLAEVDPSTGTIKRIVGDTTERQLYGLGYWAGKGYAFSVDGTISVVDMLTGKGTPFQPNGVTQKLLWFGAGVSTQAPAQ